MKATEYNYDIVRSFVNWSVVWGVVAVLVGVIVSLQMVEPGLNFPPYLTFGRLRPIHTNAGIYGWGVGVIFATFLYIGSAFFDSSKKDVKDKQDTKTATPTDTAA